jgi:hypothetical protein
MATSANIGVNQNGHAAAELITVQISAKLGKKLTYSQAFVEAEKIVRAAIGSAAHVPAEASE